jgi:hypothetical protein
MRIRNALPLFAFICIAIVFAVGMVPLGHTARLVPLIVLCITGALLALATILECVDWTRPGFDSALDENEPPNTKKPGTVNRSALLATDLIWFMGAPALMFLLGLILGSALFVFLYATKRARYPVARSLVYASTTGIVLLAVISLLPTSEVYNGMLLSWLTA